MPFGLSGPLPETAPTTTMMANNDSDNRFSVASESSRQSLQHEMRLRRDSLTASERAFLAQLCLHGSERELRAAHENLKNPDVFPPPPEVVVVVSAATEPHRGSGGWHRMSSLDVEGVQSVALADWSDNEAEDMDRSIPVSIASHTSVGSDARQKALDERKNNYVFGKMWKAHQSGLAVSLGASRRSLIRNASISLMSTSSGSHTRRELYQRADEIFRARRGSSGGGRTSSSSRSSATLLSSSPPPLGFRRGAAGPPLMDNRSDNNRRVSFPHLYRAAAGGAALLLPKVPRSASISAGCPPPKPFPKPVLRRMQSEGSARKVTFGELPPRVDESPSDEERAKEESDEEVVAVPAIFTTPPPPSGPTPPMRMDSISSIPSLHMAHSIRSPASSVVLSQASYPSLHLAHHIGSIGGDGSVSFRRDSSLAADDSFQLDSQEFGLLLDPDAHDEKKEEASDDGDDVASPFKGVAPMLRPVLLRNASVNTYDGVGIEVQDSPPKEILGGPLGTVGGGHVQVLWKGANDADHPFEGQDEVGPVLSGDQSRMESLLSFGESTVRCNSFDETLSHHRISSIFRRTFRRSLSDADLAGIFLGGSRLLLHETSSVKDVNPSPLDESSYSWVMDDESDLDYYDTWKVIEDEYENGYGGGGTLPFVILGTSADDVDAHPHVLSPPLIESLQAFLPLGQSGNNFWMKYSLVRDGANLITFLQQARGARYTILALETVDGEVFGAFTTEPWRKNWNTFGGGESFLWRMRHSRKIKCHSIIDQAHKESIVDVYPYTGANNYIQFCTQDRIAVGGGSPTTVPDDKEVSPEVDVHEPKKHEWGFGTCMFSSRPP